MMMKLPKGQPPRCPICGSNNVAWIFYSPVEMNDELAMMIQTKKIVLRPAEQSPANKTYYCHHCGYTW